MHLRKYDLQIGVHIVQASLYEMGRVFTIATE